MMGGVGPNQQAGFTIGNQDDYPGKQIASTGQPADALGAAEYKHGCDGQRVEGYDQPALRRGQAESEGSEGEIDEETYGDLLANERCDRRPRAGTMGGPASEIGMVPLTIFAPNKK